MLSPSHSCDHRSIYNRGVATSSPVRKKIHLSVHLAEGWFLRGTTFGAGVRRPAGISQIFDAPGGRLPFSANLPGTISFIEVNAGKLPVSRSVENIPAAKERVCNEISPVRLGVDNLITTLFTDFP